ncbi:MAG: hypothetical protein EBR53_04010 [Actinobacteria bacterium]|nr:hypothetical protein [Actinomycetota bacterium]
MQKQRVLNSDFVSKFCLSPVKISATTFRLIFLRRPHLVMKSAPSTVSKSSFQRKILMLSKVQRLIILKHKACSFAIRISQTFAGHDKEGTAYFTMGGGCHGCSMSRQTMLEGVQTMVSAKVPSITKVRDLTDHSTGENPFFK